MKNNYKTLIVVEHGAVMAGINDDLLKVTESTGSTFETYYATKCSQALSILKRESEFDLLFLDIKLSSESYIDIYADENPATEIRKLHPNALIVVATSSSQPVHLRIILKRLNPEGFIVHKDISYVGLAQAIEESLRKPPYYSRTVIEYLRTIESLMFILSKRELLLLKGIDNGLTLEEIGEEISLSKSAVAVRKKKLKSQFGVEEGNDRDLIRRARETGYI